MTEQDAVNDLAPLFLNEGFSLDHDSNMVSTIHVDFRMPDERSPIGAVVKYGQAKYAIEHSGTIQLTRPPYFRKEGETLIYDKGEGLVTKKTVARREAPAAVQDAWIQLLGDVVEKAAESVGLTVLSKSITLKDAIITVTDQHTIEWGKRDFWLLCTVMEPTSDAQSRALLESLDPDYDHESYIPSARTFAQMLGRAYVEQYGAPYDAEDPFEHTVDGVFVGNTYHCKLGVIHGPVVYVDDPYVACTAAMSAQSSMVRTMLPIFVKHKDYSDQREYRFVIPDKTQHEADSKIMPAPPGLLAAIGRHGDSKGPMVVPDFHIPSGTTRGVGKSTP